MDKRDSDYLELLEDGFAEFMFEEYTPEYAASQINKRVCEIPGFEGEAGEAFVKELREKYST